MSVVRGTALSNYPALVTELGGDPAGLLRAAGIRDRDAGTAVWYITAGGIEHAAIQGSGGAWTSLV